MFGLSFPTDRTDVYKPADLLAEFRNIPVDCDGIEVTVRVKKYRNLSHVGKVSGTENAVAVMSGLDTVSKGLAGRDCRGPGKNPWLDVFTGKGSPGNIGIALTALYRYRKEFIQRYEKGPYPMLRACAQMLVKKAGDPAAMMQEACDLYIGLDCSGFAGRYIENVNPKWGSPQSIIPMLPNGRTKRTKLDEITVGDLLVWTDPNHVALIDARVGEPDQFRIAQSTGPGLIRTICKLTASKSVRGKFAYVVTQGALPSEPKWDAAKDGAGGRLATIVSLAPIGQTFPSPLW